jgi:small subunit ribosomal protein S21|tara:strand:- start:2207 stop:2416 length:210 start_codon:yes stop_codon:yes gene_type:complete
MTIEVQVRGGNVTKAMRILKKKLERDGLMQEIRRRQYYEKPSEKKLREKKQNMARVRKREKERARNDDF